MYVTLGLTLMAVLCPSKALAMLHRLAHEGCCLGTCSVTIMDPEVGCSLSSASQMKAGKEGGGSVPNEGTFAPSTLGVTVLVSPSVPHSIQSYCHYFRYKGGSPQR